MYRDFRAGGRGRGLAAGGGSKVGLEDLSKQIPILRLEAGGKVIGPDNRPGGSSRALAGRGQA